MAMVKEFSGNSASVASTRGKNTFAQFYAISAILLGTFHLVTGSMLILVFVFTVISLIGAGFLMKDNPRYSDFFIFLLSIYSGYAALLMKAMLSQPLQQNLMVPMQSAAYLFIGFCSISICAMAASLIVGSRQSPIGARLDNPGFMRKALIPLLILGFTTRMLHIILNPPIKDGADMAAGFGGFGTFNFVLLLACGLLLRQYASNRTSFYGVMIILVIVMIAGLAVVTNTKRAMFDCIALGIVSIYAFGIKVKIRILVLGSVLFVVVFLFIAPAIHLMRSGLKDMTLIERITGMYSLIEEHGFSPASLALAESGFMEGFTYSFAEYSSYIYPNSSNLDRFVLILPVDQVARGLDNVGALGISPFLKKSAESVLPSIFISKTPQAGTDIVAWHHGIRASGSIARPVLGFVAISLAASGLLGVVLLPWVFIFPALLVMNYVFGVIKGRVFGVLGFVVGLTMIEVGIESFTALTLRTVPIILVTVLIFLRMFSRPLRIGKIAL